MTQDQFKILDNHLGYGSSNPRYIIMGLEEGVAGAGVQNTYEKNQIITQANYEHRFLSINGQLMDLVDYHLGNPDPNEFAWFGDNAKPQTTWQWYCKLLLGLEFGYWNNSDLLDYQKTRLGRVTGCNNAIIEFLPLPRHDHKAWFTFMNVDNTNIQSKRSYLDSMLTVNRKSLINEVFDSDNLEVVIVHGSLRGNKLRPYYNNIIETLNLIYVGDHVLGVKGKKVITNIYGKEYRNKNSKIRVFFTPFLGVGAMTNEALQNLIKIVRD